MISAPYPPLNEGRVLIIENIVKIFSCIDITEAEQLHGIWFMPMAEIRGKETVIMAVDKVLPSPNTCCGVL